MSAPRHHPFTALYAPNTELELSLLRSRLDAEEIPYTVTNDHFGSLYIGVQIESFNRRWILVDDNALPQAQVVLQDFLTRQQPPAAMPQTTHSGWNKLRAVLEVVLLGWMVPRRQSAVFNNAMTYKLQFDHQQHLFIATTSGPLTAHGMTDLGQTLLKHPQWQPGMSVIFDHRHLTFISTAVEELDAIRDFHRNHQDQIGHGKSAFVVGPERVEAWLALWQQGNKVVSDHRTAVFEELDEAQEWIRQAE